MAVIEKAVNIDTWELSTNGEKLYSADVVIDAYLKGKKDQLEQTQRTLINQLETNLRKAAMDTAKVFKHLSDHGITPLSAHLKPITYHHLEVLITVTPTDFLSENITEAYDYMCTVEEGGSEDLYRISFRLIDEGEGFDESLLESDGFAFKREIATTPLSKRLAKHK